MVLRAANATQQTLTAFTDHRNAKAFELAHHPQAQFVFWSERLKRQLRMRALVTVQTSGPDIDWLELSASGHRRARIGPESWKWLTPIKGANATRAHSHAELFAPRTHQIGSRAESFGPLAELSARRLS